MWRGTNERELSWAIVTKLDYNFYRFYLGNVTMINAIRILPIAWQVSRNLFHRTDILHLCFLDIAGYPRINTIEIGSVNIFDIHTLRFPVETSSVSFISSTNLFCTSVHIAADCKFHLHDGTVAVAIFILPRWHCKCSERMERQRNYAYGFRNHSNISKPSHADEGNNHVKTWHPMPTRYLDSCQFDEKWFPRMCLSIPAALTPGSKIDPYGRVIDKP